MWLLFYIEFVKFKIIWFVENWELLLFDRRGDYTRRKKIRPNRWLYILAAPSGQYNTKWWIGNACRRDDPYYIDQSWDVVQLTCGHGMPVCKGFLVCNRLFYSHSLLRPAGRHSQHLLSSYSSSETFKYFFLLYAVGSFGSVEMESSSGLKQLVSNIYFQPASLMPIYGRLGYLGRTGALPMYG